MQTCDWPLGNGTSFRFEIYNRNDGWHQIAGLYIFCYATSNGNWTALYIGQTNDFSTRLPNHERLPEAIRLGATHIHAVVVPSQKDRNDLEQKLIYHIQPRMNELLR